jgi:hypothetical protein
VAGRVCFGGWLCREIPPAVLESSSVLQWNERIVLPDPSPVKGVIAS